MWFLLLQLKISLELHALEINLAISEVLSNLIKIFNSREEVIKIKDSYITKGNAIFICAMNPPSVGGGRRSLPISLKNLLTNINLDALTVAELRSIVEIKYSKKINILISNNIDIVFWVHQ